MKEIAVWILIWFFVWGIFNGFFRWFTQRFSYRRFVTHGFFFLLSFIVVYFKYERLLLPHIPDLIIGFVVANLIGSILSLNKNFYQTFVKDRFFLIFQSFNILFQQAMIIVSLSLLKNFIGSGYTDYIYGLFFVIVHLPIIFFKKRKFFS